MSDAPKAVFLSYASQDAEAAKKICDALRSAGVEVWFDQSELRGGDAWDAKIRRQIKECALFIPVITANTNSRPEGYFRLEWKLAVDRSHLLAEDHPFLFPIVIGEVVQETARVPDKFRDVQWTRMRLDETPAELANRVARLLSGSGLEPIADGARAKSKARKMGKPAWLRYAWSLIALILVAKFFIFRPQRKPEDLAKTVASAQRMVELASKTGALKGGDDKTDAGQLSEKAFALTQKLSFAPEDLATAETLAQRATDLAPDSARAWGVRAWVQAAYLMRNFDLSDHRIQETQTAANHALALDADEVNALNALSEVYEKQTAPAEVIKLARRAIALDPRNFRAHANLGRALQDSGQIDEARKVLRDAVNIYPDNPLAHYDLAGSYVNSGLHRQLPRAQDVATALEQLDASIALQPFSSSLMCKAALVGGMYGDLPGMRQQIEALEKLSLAERTSDRAVFIGMFGGLCDRNPARVFKAASLTAKTYFEDGVVMGPKGWFTALAYHLQGKENSARSEWQAAEAVLREKLRARAGDPLLTVQLAITLAWLGRDDEAAREIQPVESVWREDLSIYYAIWLGRYYAARGDAARAAPYLKKAMGYHSFLTGPFLVFDPWWDKLRGQPEFDDLIKDVKAQIEAGKRVTP